jgi:hypothetical protein
MYHGDLHRLAIHVAKLLSHMNIDDAEWVKENMPGNDDNLEFHLELCYVSRSNATFIE